MSIRSVKCTNRNETGVVLEIPLLNPVIHEPLLCHKMGTPREATKIYDTFLAVHGTFRCRSGAHRIFLDNNSSRQHGTNNDHIAGRRHVVPQPCSAPSSGLFITDGGAFHRNILPSDSATLSLCGKSRSISPRGMDFR